MKVTRDFDRIVFFLWGNESNLDGTDLSEESKRIIQNGRKDIISRTFVHHSIPSAPPKILSRVVPMCLYFSNSFLSSKPYAIMIDGLPYDITAFRPDLRDHQRIFGDYKKSKGIHIVGTVYYEHLSTIEGVAILPRYLVFKVGDAKVSFVNVR